MTTPIRAVLFDMDGTLVDNMRFHVQAWLRLCERYGWKAEASQFLHELAGMKNEELIPRIAQRTLSAAEVQQLADEKEAEYRALFRPHLALHAGAGALIQRCRAHGLKLGVASAAPEANRAFVLQGLGLLTQFDAVAGAEQAVRGKPAPDIFLAAAKLLDVEPGACIVFEDAINGIRAARAAGMPAVGVATETSAEALLAAGAMAAIATFEQLPESVETLIFG